MNSSEMKKIYRASFSFITSIMRACGAFATKRSGAGAKVPEVFEKTQLLGA